jgi:hypothetical protein
LDRYLDRLHVNRLRSTLLLDEADNLEVSVKAVLRSAAAFLLSR